MGIMIERDGRFEIALAEIQKESVKDDEAHLSKDSFIQLWKQMRDIPVEDFIADEEQQSFLYRAFTRHERVARAVSDPPVLTFKELVINEDPHFMGRAELSMQDSSALTSRSGLPKDRIIARFFLADAAEPQHIYFLTPPIGVIYPVARTSEIGVARVPVTGGFKELYDTKTDMWNVNSESGIYVRQNTRNVPEIKNTL